MNIKLFLTSILVVAGSIHATSQTKIIGEKRSSNPDSAKVSQNINMQSIREKQGQRANNSPRVTDRDTIRKVTITPPKKRPSPEIISDVKLEDINEWLCPSKLVRGDREFDGHGPKISTEVKLRISRDSATLIADITFSAVETQHDWSTTTGNWSKVVYKAPYGKKITGIVSDKASRTQYVSPPGGFQFLVPGADVSKVLYEFLDHTDIKSAVLKAFGYGAEEKSALSALVKGSIDNGNTVVRLPAVEGTLVKFFHIVGDTGGPDISHDNNCNDDTRIVKIEFFPARIKFRAE